MISRTSEVAACCSYASFSFAGLAVEFFLQIDNARMAAPRSYRRVAARLRLSGFAMPRFHRFTGFGAVPSHLALHPVGGPHPITALSRVVHHSRIGLLRSEVGQEGTSGDA